MRAVVVGGGIGGLVAAIALRQRGWAVTVVESAAKFGEVGAGVQLGPNATRVLARLGLDEELTRVAVTPEVVRFCRWADDAVLTEWPVKQRMRERFGAPYYTLYRPDLIEVLARAQPAGQVLLGARVTGVATGGDGATVSTVDGRRLEADLVLGCDGIHSTVRSRTVGDAPARFSGMCAYRALVPADGTEPKVRTWLGPGRHLVAYPVGRGGRYLNLVGVVPAADWRTESWVAPGDAGDLRRHFAGWSASVAGLLDRVGGPVYRWALYDREPLPAWVARATALLGDACHPMLPFLAQGAAQAVEDAGVLAECLADADVPAALERYQRLRLPKASRIQRMSWDNNTAYHLPDGPEQRARDEAMRRGEAFALDAVSWLFEDTG
ncbi:FAD-dependent monooxygenase [Amycolatopsis sp. NPDC088138]|uniref:FAD-dependent monooxygenase n=1 Tax=Amycolatopsis sp. NPDC088138 TaxID=3363938 RepID=UPI003809E8F2